MLLPYVKRIYLLQGHLVYDQGDFPQKIFLLKRGTIDFQVYREGAFHTVLSSDSVVTFGFVECFLKTSRNFRAVCTSARSKLYQIEFSHFDRIFSLHCEDYPRIIDQQILLFREFIDLSFSHRKDFIRWLVTTEYSRET